MLFRARQFEFVFPRPVVVMGIVNVTPDSFSDGGRFLNPDAAVRHALSLAAQGAEILDIGGESTRPGAKPVAAGEELRRVIPVIEAVVKKTKVALSIDTLKPAIARAALAAGASMVNDVGAYRRNRAMWKVVADFQAGYVCLHAQGSPDVMQKKPVYHDVVREIGEFFRERMGKLAAAGIAPEQIVLDPGIGFGKNPGHNLELLAHLEYFTRLGRPVLLGASRKSFMEKISGARLNERLPASLACATLAVASGARIIRAHDVAETMQAVRMAEAILSRKSNVD
jgi:dihydropteroate synthase